MKIAVNTRLLIKGKLDGIAWFSYEIMKRMVRNHPEDEFVFIFDRPYDADFLFEKNVSAVVVHPQARHPILWWIYFQFSLPIALRKINADAFISLDGYLPNQEKIPMLNVIHDINFEHNPNMLPNLVSKYYRKYFPNFARKANRLATVSEFSKADIAETYRIATDKIDVVYNGVHSDFKAATDKVKIGMREKYTNGEDFLIFVGALHQRKNVVNMLKAFDQLKEEWKQPLKFVIAGKKMWWTDEMERTLQKMRHKIDVVFTGRIDPQKELICLLASARAMLYVPFYEGFGLPVLEAHKCGIPVITSNVSSLPEVAGEAALFCDPSKVGSISAALLKLLKNEQLQKDLIASGIKNAERFSWEKSSELLWTSLEKMLDETS